MAISGTGITLATLGGVLAYAGFTGQNPIAALKAISTGHPGGVAKASSYTNTEVYPGLDQAVAAAGTGTNPGAAAGGVLAGAVGAGPNAWLASGVLAFVDDKYSQAKRWQTGFSDCSSIVGKAFKARGITPPGASTTGNYLLWSKLRKLSSVEIPQAGDLVVSPSHMAVVFDSKGNAIGQQNTRENVVINTVSFVMYGTGAYGYYRYTGGGF